MNTKQKYEKLLDELIAGNPKGIELDQHFDLVLSWLARPDSDVVAEFRNEYQNRTISDEILRGYILFVIEQKLFSKLTNSPREILGLSSVATKEQIKSRYKKLIRIYHPDRSIGDKRVLNSHAESINQAYKRLSDDNFRVQKIVSKPQSSVKQASPNDLTRVKGDLIIRKLRRKLGGVKQFQIMFFGVLSSICLLLIVLIFFQSDSVELTQDYYKSRSVTVSEDNKNQVEINQQGISDDIEEEKDILNSIINEDQILEEDHLLVSNSNSQFVPETSEQNSELLISQDDSIKQTQSVDDINLSTVLEKDNQQDILESPIIDDAESLEQKTILTKKVPTQQTTIKTEDSSTIKPKQIKSESDKSSQPESNLTKKEKNKRNSPLQVSDKLKPKVQENLDIEEPNLNTKQAAATESIAITKQAAPIKEISIKKIASKSKTYAKANLFERRFARKFVITYLESIEKGNVNLINDILSDSLSVNGVANRKTNYLNNTTQMIRETNKRSYSIKFIGDVLRLDKGSFRVTLKVNRVSYSKDNTKSQNDSFKIYDIKRYSNGSEIVSISDA